VNTLAVLLDTRPSYAEDACTGSLLLAPLGTGTVLRYLSDRLSTLGYLRVTVVTAFEPEVEYVRRIERSGVKVDAVLPVRQLPSRIADYEPSDWLVIVDPRCVPLRGLKPRVLMRETDGGPRRVRHLVALEAHPGGTTERVQLGDNGTVGRIQRYYDYATWPFTSGVACSMIPISCTVGAHDLPFTCLRELRRRLAERGVPSNDVFIQGGAFDLSKEPDLLGLSDRLVIEHFSRQQGTDDGWLAIAPGCHIDPTARLLGPVVLQEGVFIGAGATVVGPAVVGPGARVEQDAMVAQCVVGQEAVIAAGLTLRHRALFGTVTESGPDLSPAVLYEAAAPPTVEPSEATDEPARSSPAYALFKAAFDMTAAGLGLLLLSPLLLLIALLIKLESRGPVFYRDRREGKGGRIFHCLKFRTMFVGAHAQQRELLAKNEVDGPQFKLVRDPRVTRIGRLLRQLSLDELPQLINVLRLEMSLVGPRPSPFRENQLCIPWRDARLSVRPGITGLWQVCRSRRLQGDFHQWIQFDLLYVRHMSFVVDLKILAATVFSLAGQWPVPSSWIVSAPEVESIQGPAIAAMRTRPPPAPQA
jgi:lipopolysaccharide/colanic/teichoic acid biosynthesis glycosyltransferase